MFVSAHSTKEVQQFGTWSIKHVEIIQDAVEISCNIITTVGRSCGCWFLILHCPFQLERDSEATRSVEHEVEQSHLQRSYCDVPARSESLQMNRNSCRLWSLVCRHLHPCCLLTFGIWTWYSKSTAKMLCSWRIFLQGEDPWALKDTWWFIPLTKWVITPVGSGFILLIPVISGVITHLLSGMNHQVSSIPQRFFMTIWTTSVRQFLPWNVAIFPPGLALARWTSSLGAPGIARVVEMDCSQRW